MEYNVTFDTFTKYSDEIWINKFSTYHFFTYREHFWLPAAADP
jgi:hypothetical protein